MNPNAIRFLSVLKVEAIIQLIHYVNATHEAIIALRAMRKLEYSSFAGRSVALLALGGAPSLRFVLSFAVTWLEQKLYQQERSKD